MCYYRIVGYVDSNDYRLNPECCPDFSLNIPDDVLLDPKHVYDTAYKVFFYGEGFLDLQLVMIFYVKENNSCLHTVFEDFQVSKS